MSQFMRCSSARRNEKTKVPTDYHQQPRQMPDMMKTSQKKIISKGLVSKETMSL